MKRREFLRTGFPVDAEPPEPGLSASSTSAGKSRRLIRTTTGIEPYTGPWNKKLARHLLRRTMFGPTRSEVESVAAGSVDRALELLLDDEPAPPLPLDPTTGQQWIDQPYSTNDFNLRNYLKAWWLGLMVIQPISIRERMVLFWHNHFVSEGNDVQDSRYMYLQNALFRQYALGNIKELVKAVTTDPAMLRYLNGNTNIKGRVQENYARELQELFTVGKGPQIGPDNYTNYTEQDVQEAAKVLTGWRDVRAAAPPRSEFLAANHDTSNKVFSSAYQNTMIRGGGTAADGPRELNELVEMIFRQQETAKYLCRKLYRWFVYYDIDQSVEQNVIAPLADIMRANNYEVKPVLEALLKSMHFYDDNNMGAFIKSPVDLVAGSIRQLGLPLPNFNTATFYSLFTLLASSQSSTLPSIRGLQMDLLDPPNVAGWPAYYQVPDFYELWINTATYPMRGAFTDAIINGYRGGASTYRVDSIIYARSLSLPGNPYTLIDDLAEELSPLTLTAKQKDYLMYNVLGAVQGGEYEWTTKWSEYIAGDPQSREFVRSKLNSLLKFIMRMAEYQLS